MFRKSHAGGAWGRGGLAVLALTMLLWAPAASAHDAYVTNSLSDDVSVIDTASGTTTGEPIDAGDGPGGIAIAPSGARAYVANFGSDDVSVIDTASNETVGEPIAVGDGPRGVAVAPDGRYVYVANEISNDVSVIDTASGEVVGGPIAVGSEPQGIAIAPDGARAYVANAFSNDVSVIDTASGETVGEPIEVGERPLAVAVTPDGARVYVTNRVSESVSVIDTATESVIDTIQLSSFLIGIAITPDGRRAYVAHYGPGTVSAIDTETDETIGEPIEVGEFAFGVAISPDGSRALVANEGSDTVSAIDTASNEAVGAQIPVGSNPLGIAIVPDQPPQASLASTAATTAGQPVRFDASASRDPDGEIARYDWDFGDGQVALSAGPTPVHTYDAPGDYRVTVTLTDSEGCSTSLVFTGLTASCNGSALARATRTLRVAAKPPPEPPSNRFHIGKPRHDLRRGTVKLQIRIPGPGKLMVRGGNVRALNRTVHREGAVTLTLRPKRMAAKKLRRRGHLNAQARITFSPDGGVPRTLPIGLKFIRRHG